MFPTIKLNKNNIYRLACHCGSVDISLEKIYMEDTDKYSYAVCCNKCTNPDGTKHIICNIDSIKVIAKSYCANKNLNTLNTYYKVLNDIYTYLKINKFIAYSTQSLFIEKTLVNKFNIELDNIDEHGMDKNHYFYYTCIINNKKYFIKVNENMDIYYVNYKKGKKFKQDDMTGFNKWSQYKNESM